MASNALPPLLTTRQHETPLDLSVKKEDDEELSSDSNAHLLNVPSFSASTSVPLEGNGLAGSKRSTPSTNTQSTMTSPVLFVQEGCTIPRVSPSVSPSLDSTASGSPDNNVLPKKRKNLWRPYDTEKLDDDKDSVLSESSCSSFETDSSDANSGGNADANTDPVKKRKLQQSPKLKEQITNSSAIANIISDSENRWDGVINNIDQEELLLKGPQLSQTDVALETRERIMPGMKKRDMFGWSRRHSQPSVLDIETSVASIGHVQQEERVHQEGDKTYFELQTVRKSSVSPPAVAEKASPSSSSGCSRKETVSPIQSTSAMRTGLERTQSPFQKKESYIEDTIRRQLSTRSPAPNETKPANFPKTSNKVTPENVKLVNTDTSVNKVLEDNKENINCEKSKEFTLIDLIEDIETAAKKETEQVTDPNVINGVTALLKQCNSVKLTALDFLMSKVMLHGDERSYKPRNDRIQQMLKGEKPGKVCMLDVLELQVEMGLSS